MGVFQGPGQRERLFPNLYRQTQRTEAERRKDNGRKILSEGCDWSVVCWYTEGYRSHMFTPSDWSCRFHYTNRAYSLSVCVCVCCHSVTMNYRASEDIESFFTLRVTCRENRATTWQWLTTLTTLIWYRREYPLFKIGLGEVLVKWWATYWLVLSL